MSSSSQEWPSWWRIAALSFTGAAVELAYAVEAGYGTPTLLKIGLEERYVTLTWSVSPVLGILFQSYLGSASDKCTCSWGRRRPFILSLGVMSLIALTVFPYGASMGTQTVVLLYTLMAFVAMDFCLDAIQSPCRAYLLDSLSKEQTKRGNLIFSIMTDVGALLGAVIGAIPWKKIGGELTDNFETQTKIVFGITAIIMFTSLLFTMFSVSEKQTRALRDNNMDENEINSESSCKCSSLMDSVKDLCASLGETFSLIKDLSNVFLTLWTFTFLGYFSLHIYYLFFTEYSGSVIYGGVADSDDQHLRDLYDKGVLTGCACLAVCNIASFLCAIVIDHVLENYSISLKQISLFCFPTHLVMVCLAMLFPNLYTAVLITLSTGLQYAVMHCVPFSLASDFERAGLVLRSKEQSSMSKVGMTVSFLYIAIFAAQCILGLLLGNLIQLFGTSRFIVILLFFVQLIGTGFVIFNHANFKEV